MSAPASIIVISPDELAVLITAAVAAALAAAPRAPERLMVADAAQHLGCGKRRLADAIRGGELPARRVGRSTTVAVADLEVWAASRDRRATRPQDEDEQLLAAAGLRRGAR